VKVEHGRPALILAPMEGVTDAPMRAFFSRHGGFTHLVSEFLRVSQDPPPVRTIREHMPELLLKPGVCETREGIPVQLQLLGGDPDKLALTAQRAVSAGVRGIDLNFGCPAPTVNRNDGGATLLKYPDRIERIVRTVRDALPPEIPVSAKLRLGWENPDEIDHNAERAVRGGAAWITIHGRTKMQAYKPPADWVRIARVKNTLNVPVVVNGDLFRFEDYRKCREEYGFEHFMIGRGALGNPALPRKVAQDLGVPMRADSLFMDWRGEPRQWNAVFRAFCDAGGLLSQDRHYLPSRIKMWVKFAILIDGAQSYPWFDELKRLHTLEEMEEVFRRA